MNQSSTLPNSYSKRNAIERRLSRRNNTLRSERIDVLIKQLIEIEKGFAYSNDIMSDESTLLERRLYEAFDVFDNARNEEIDVRDLGTVIRALGCVITEAELQEIQVELEDVENNCVPLNRFIECMSKAINERKFKPAEPEDLLRAFQVLDPENRGYIMRDDLEKSIMEIGEPFTKEEVAEMMSVACDPTTGKINYEHYINLLIVKIPEDINVYDIADKIEAARLAALPKKHKMETMFFKEDNDS